MPCQVAGENVGANLPFEFLRAVTVRLRSLSLRVPLGSPSLSEVEGSNVEGSEVEL